MLVVVSGKATDWKYNKYSITSIAYYYSLIDDIFVNWWKICIGIKFA